MARYSSSSTRGDNNNNKRNWEQPPQVANPHVVSSASFNGLTIGRSLELALNELSKEEKATAAKTALPNPLADDETNETTREDEEEKMQQQGGLKKLHHVDQDGMDAILKAFGDAVANTPWPCTITKTKSAVPQPQPPPSRTTAPVVETPAALLRGRVDHYNRMGSKWIMVIDHVELMERPTLPGHKKKKRKKQRESLWEIAEKSQGEDENPQIPIQGRVHINAYDDN